MASGGPTSGRPLMAMLPEVIGTSPARHFISVLLPQPLGADDADEGTGPDLQIDIDEGGDIAAWRGIDLRHCG
jgi:hypothetical protein